MSRVVLLFVFMAYQVCPLQAESKTGHVLVSLPVFGSIVQEVAGPNLNVNSILSENVDPHHFEMNPGQRKDIHRADLIVLASPQFEFWFPHSEYKGKVLYLVEDQEQLHFWVDPKAVENRLPMLVTALCQKFSSSCDSVKDRSKLFRTQLIEISKSLRSEIESWQHRKFIATHGSWAGFAERFNLQVAATIGHHDHMEASGYQYRKLYAAHHHGLPLFVEDYLEGQQFRGLIEDLGLKPVKVDPIGRIQESYKQFLLRNVNGMSQVMKGDSSS